MSGRIRTGIVGFGVSGRVFHAPLIHANPDFSLEAIVTAAPIRNAAARREYPDTRIVDSLNDLLELDLDLVVLGTPGHVHVDQGLAALRSGAAVVVDKPFAPTAGEAEQLLTVAGEVGRPITVFQNRRWDGDFLTVKKLVESGTIGQVYRFESTFERWNGALRDRWQDRITVSQAGGVAFDLGAHLIDQAIQLFGAAEVEYAQVASVRSGAVSDDDAFVSLVHHTGVRTHLTMSRVAGQSGPRFRVLGSEGSYVVYGLDPQEAALAQGVRPTDPRFGVANEAEWGSFGLGGDLEPVPTERGDYPEFYRRLALTLNEGAELPVNPLDSLNVVRLLERATESGSPSLELAGS